MLFLTFSKSERLESVSSKRFENRPNAQQLRNWTEYLAQWTPSERFTKSKEVIRDIRKAERLWAQLCDGILDTLDREVAQSRLPVHQKIQDLTTGRGIMAQRILSFQTVYTFYLSFATGHCDIRAEEYTQLQIQNQYLDLVTHLKGMVNIDEEWRIFQAFESTKTGWEYRCRRFLSIKDTLEYEVAEDEQLYSVAQAITSSR
ncbi:MAG: hypothetical protein Q9220_001788 [cf. Caloplaca sp. 1 TL-2023]